MIDKLETSTSTKKNFSSIDWLTNMATKKHKENNLDEAITYYLEIISIDEKQPVWVYANLLILCSQKKYWMEGLSVLDKILKIHPNSEETYRAIGLYYENNNSISESIKFYQKAINLDFQQPNWLYCNLAKQLMANNQLDEAVIVCKKGISIYSNFDCLYYVLGNALTKQEKWDESILAYRKVQELNPHWDEVNQKINRIVFYKNRLERYQYAKNDLNLSNISKNINTNTEISNLTSVNFQYNSIINSEEITILFKENNINVDLFFNCLKEQKISVTNCYEIWKKNTATLLSINYGAWLSPNILYVEIHSKQKHRSIAGQILATSTLNYAIGNAEFFHITDDQTIGIVCFDKALNQAKFEEYKFGININNSLTWLENSISLKAYKLEIIDHLQNKPDYQKHLIRESLCSSVIKLIGKSQKSQAAELLEKLQYFLYIPPKQATNLNLPFKIFIDYIIPLKSEGLFISGWMQDPYQMLEKITAVSALGFSLTIDSKDIYRLERKDVNQLLQNSRYGNFEAKLGFCVYSAVPETIQQSLEGLAELHSFRFLVQLQGNVEIEIIPDVKYDDAYNSRQKVMQIADTKQVSPEMLTNCLAPVVLKLQQQCIEQVKIKEVSTIYPLPDNPLISIIIPLYQRLDFLKVQFATMANDPAIAQCEIIYVLDSPEQESELKTFLLNHCNLYQLSVKLVVMERNSGYAAANNAGASQAQGKYLILLNSDVFAKTKGWMVKMAEFYQSNPKIGSLGAKLLYEDDSLQHAGMFFAQTTFPFWITLHYYKGLPVNYPPAQTTRSVPAVTGACLMIERELYQKVGGLTTDYIIGDFEDSDLCFKCQQLGYESWYFADAVLYHLERQSIPLNSSYNGSLAWRLNGHLHQERWGKQITKIMSCLHG